jgi:hypothetical protein
MTATAEPDVKDWREALRHLSMMPEKRDAFLGDIYFRESWSGLAPLREKANEGARSVYPYASLILKPECLLGGTGPLALRLLASSGFRPVFVQPFSFNHLSARELWRYWLMNATLERLEAMTTFLSSFESLYVIVEDETLRPNMPASVRLAKWKGAADVAERASGSLRSAVNVLEHPLLTGVHTADEPADFVRELGVLFDKAARERITQQLLGRLKPLRIDAVCQEIAGAYAPRELRFERLTERLIRLIRCYDQGLSVSSEIAHLIALVERVHGGERGLWREIDMLLERHGIPFGREDRIVMAVTTCKPFIEERTQAFSRQGLDAWEAHGEVHSEQ